MAGDPNALDWQPGQPPPWLDAYGPPPVDDALAGSPAAPAAVVDPDGAGGEQAEPAPDAEPAPASSSPPMPASLAGPAPIDPTLAGAPGATLAPAPGGRAAPEAPQPPPWIANLQQQGPAGPQPAAPPWQQPAPRAPAPPSPDAISGGPTTAGENPDDKLAQVAVDPSASVSDRAGAWARLSPEVRTNLVNSADPQQLAAAATAAMSPEELATIGLRHEQARVHWQSAQQLTLAQKADEDARKNFQTYTTAIQQANTDTAQLEHDAAQLSQQKIDPNEHGVGHFIASVLTAAVAGFGSKYTGGRNLALEELDKKTQQRIDAQKANIANQWRGIGMKQNLIAQQLQRSGDLYRAQETYRIATYDRALSELQAKAQDYDPQGTTGLRIAGAIQQIGAQRAQSIAAFNQQQTKNRLDAMKAQGTYDLNEANAAKAQAETAKLRGEIGGGGAANGSPTNPNFSVPTGLFDPFTKQPIFAKQKIKDTGKVAEAINGYQQVQRRFAELLALARKMHGDFSAGGQTWSRMQSTDEAEFEQKRMDLLETMLHARGERISPEGIKSQGILVPDLTKFLGKQDTVKMLEDSKTSIDGQFSGYMNTLGINGDQIITNAQRYSAPAPQPGTPDQITAANEAVETAQTPTQRKDALAAVHAAQERATSEAAKQQQVAAALKEAPTLTPQPLRLVHKDWPADVQGKYRSVNDAWDTYNQRLAQYHAVLTAKEPDKTKLADAALKVKEAREAAQLIQKDAEDALYNAGKGIYRIDTDFH